MKSLLKYKINFEKIENVSNPNSVHGIYPYRGKISAKDTINIIQHFSKNKTLLDPFCGSGTIVYEGHKHGLNVIGVDNNPLALILTRGKLNLKNLDFESIQNEINTIIKKSKSVKKPKSIPKCAKHGFHNKTAMQIMRINEYYGEMSDYLKAVFCGSICLAARGCNNYLWTSTSVGKNYEPKKYIDFYDKLKAKSKKHFMVLKNTNNSKVFLNDSRKLSAIIPKNSVDYVFTSPPYFNALDYTAYYAKFVMPILGMDRLQIKKNLIQSIKSYEEDMIKVLSELDIVTKNNAVIIFVVGDKKIKNEIINGGEFFSKMYAKKPNTILERNYSGSASKVFDSINKTSRKEQIIIWDKHTW